MLGLLLRVEAKKSRVEGELGLEMTRLMRLMLDEWLGVVGGENRVR